MPNGDSNAIFDSSGIFIVGTCLPMKMIGKFAFFDSLSRPPAVRRDFLLEKFTNTR